jgi:hypothetical protein
MPNYNYHASTKEEIKTRFLVGQLKKYEENPDMEKSPYVQVTIKLLAKVRLLVPYRNLSTVMKGGIPRGTPSQTGVAVQAVDKIHW